MLNQEGGVVFLCLWGGHEHLLQRGRLLEGIRYF